MSKLNPNSKGEKDMKKVAAMVMLVLGFTFV
jgi:hypothetical protein